MDYGFFTAQEFLPHGIGMGMYSAAHITWLVVLGVLVATISAVYKRLGQTGRKRMRIGLSCGLVASEMCRVCLLAAQGVYTAFYWPLHLCGLAMFILLGFALRPNRFCGETLYSLCLPGAFAALLFPDWVSNQPVWQFQSVHSFLYHGVLVGGIFMLLLGGDIRPRADGLKYPVLMLACIAPPLYFLNKLVAANFLFLNTPSRGSPLEIFSNAFGNPGYLLPFGALVLVVVSLFYLPIWVKNALAKRHTQKHTVHS